MAMSSPCTASCAGDRIGGIIPALVNASPKPDHRTTVNNPAPTNVRFKGSAATKPSCARNRLVNASGSGQIGANPVTSTSQTPQIQTAHPKLTTEKSIMHHNRSLRNETV